ncbi:nitroreductase family protein [Candidatus Woesearchaeota archaeon]|nr:nitroreductase family protein [Candidatus Woesearchaeota archaeon]
MEVFDAIKGRRCVRKFKKKEIPEEVLYNVLEAARWAPSSGNLQNTRLLIIKDKAKKEFIVKEALGQTFIADAPVVLIVCSDTDIIKRHYDERGEKLYAIQNTAAAIQNILLAAYNQGLAGSWIGAFKEVRLRKKFEIPDKIDIHAIIPLGYPVEHPYAPARIPLSDILYFKKWGKIKAAKDLFPLSESGPRIAKHAARKAKKTAKKLKKKIKRK